MTPPAADPTPASPAPPPLRSSPRPSLPVLIALVIVPLYALDQWTKSLVIAHLDLDLGKRVVIPGFFSLVHWTNKGAAFGLFQNQYAFFLVLSTAALIVLTILYRRGNFDDLYPRAGFALLIPGILGNLTDRLARGEVIDFLLFDLHVPGAHPWPAFNVADSCICVAVVCFLIGSWHDAQVERNQLSKASSVEA